VGRADLTKEQYRRSVPTSERLHHAGGDPLQSGMEVSLQVEIDGLQMTVTFNVVDAARFPLGFLLGMDVLEKYGVLIDAGTRQARFRRKPLEMLELQDLRDKREKALTSVGAKAIVCPKFEEVAVSHMPGVTVRDIRDDWRNHVPVTKECEVHEAKPEMKNDEGLDQYTREGLCALLRAKADQGKPEEPVLVEPPCQEGLSNKVEEGLVNGRSEAPALAVKAPGCPRVLKAKSVSGAGQAGRKWHGGDTYSLKDRDVKFLETFL
jgi:hypothetical protein